MPIAQLYSRAYNSKDARGRHDNGFYLLEALVKLAVAPAAACYLHEIDHGGDRSPELDRLLAQLALPSLGQWVGMLRELSRRFGQRPDASTHPLGHLWSQLDRPRRNLPALVALYRQINNGHDGAPAGDESCSLLALFDALVQYRNLVFGHGAARFDSFYDQSMGPLLFPEINEVLAGGVFEFLGPAGSRLVQITDVRTIDEGRKQIALRELVGLQGERIAPMELTTEQAASLLPNRVAILWPGRPAPLRLDPLLQYREGELADELLFFNRDRNRRQVEHLSYTTGRTERDKSMLPALASLLSRVTNNSVSDADLERLEEQSLTETPSLEGLFQTQTPARTLGDYEILAELGRGGMGVVNLARQLSLGRLVALKMLPADRAGDEVALASFRREIRHLAHCDHPNIIKVLSSGTLPDGQHYTKEYVLGSDLETVWRELAGPNRQGATSTLGNSTWARAVLTASCKRREVAERSRGGRESVPGDGGGVPQDAPAPQPGDSALPIPPLPELPNVADDPGGYVRRVAMLVRDAALALQAVHDQWVVHRDVKPASRRSSTRIRGRSSRAGPSRADRRNEGLRSAWANAAGRWTTRSSNGCDGR